MPPSTTFEGRTREEVQAKARRALHLEVGQMQVLRHGRERYGGLFGFFQRERWVLEVEMPERPRGRRRRDAAAGAGDTTPIEQLLEDTTDVVDVDFSRTLADVIAAAEATVAPPPPPLDEIRTRVDDKMPPFSRVQIPAPHEMEELTGPPMAELTGPPPTISPQVRARAQLIAAGLADHLLPDPDVEDTELGLLASLLRLDTPPPLPRGAGDVVVLVGPLAATARLATQLASATTPSASSAPSTVLVASPHPAAGALPGGAPHPLRTVAAVGIAVFKRRAAGERTILALDADAGDDHLRRLVDGVRADAVWGVVPAGADRAYVERLAARAGGRLDALALHGLAHEHRPAGLIGAEWPVAYVDGWAATPLALAARLIEVAVGTHPEAR